MEIPHVYMYNYDNIQYSDVLYISRCDDDVTNNVRLVNQEKLAKFWCDDVTTPVLSVPRTHITKGAKERVPGIVTC